MLLAMLATGAGIRIIHSTFGRKFTVRYLSSVTVHRRVPVTKTVDVSVLAEPIQFQTSGRVAKNRFMKAPMTEFLATYDVKDVRSCGLVTDRLVNLYEKFGNGGFGLLLTGNVIIHPTHFEAPHNTLICKEGDSEERRISLRNWATACKADGALAIVQINHSGIRTPIKMNPNPYSACNDCLSDELKERCIELSEEQIKTEVIDRFVFAAKASADAGFDGVQIHAGYGWILGQFVSPHTNHRTDKYGGSVENRVRVVKEIYDGIRSILPASTGFIVGIKLNSPQFRDNPEELAQYATTFNQIGLDFAELGGGNMEKLAAQDLRQSTISRESFFERLLLTFKAELTNTAVYVTGGFRTVPGMVTALQEGKCDGISMARPVAAEPDLPKKLLTGRAQSAAFSSSEMINDFITAKRKANTQLAQASLTNMAAANNDVCYGISDFSSEVECERYEKELGEFLQQKKIENQPFEGFFEYRYR